MKLEIEVRVFRESSTPEDPGHAGDPVEVEIHSADLESGVIWVYLKADGQVTAKPVVSSRLPPRHTEDAPPKRVGWLFRGGQL